MGGRRGLYLALLKYVVEKGGSARFSELCSFLNMSRGACGNYLNYLIKRGLIERVGVGVYRVTDAGKQLVESDYTMVKIAKLVEENLVSKYGIIIPSDAEALEAFIVEFEARPRIDPERLIDDLGWLGPESGIVDIGEFDEESFREAARASNGWSKVHYINGNSHFFNIFDPPGYNVIVRIDGGGSSLGIWTAVIGPHEFFKPYSPSMLIRLAASYSIYYIHLIDAMVRVKQNSRLLVKSIMTLRADSMGNIKSIKYATVPSNYTVEELINSLIAQPEGD